MTGINQSSLSRTDFSTQSRYKVTREVTLRNQSNIDECSWCAVIIMS